MYYLLIIAGGLMTMDTIWLSTVCNGNLGTALPAIMGVPLLLIGLFKRFFIPWFRTPAGHLVKVLLIVCYSAAVVFFCCMGAMLGSAAHRKADYGKDVLIVLGCAVRGERVSLTLKLRLDAALEYLEHSPNTAVIVSGGKGDGENISEAEAMKRYLVSHGVDESRIITEDKSTSTWENFKFSKAILDERFPGASSAFVTTNFHVYRAGRVAIMNGIEAEGYGAKDVWYTKLNNYMRESIAVAVYKLRGLLI